MEERDFDKRPYSADERRVCDYIQKASNNQVGCGDDPIGFLIAANQYLAKTLRDLVSPQRLFGPLPADAWVIEQKTVCPLCSQPFLAGEWTTLVETKPADEGEAAKKAAGRAYTAEAEQVHAGCWLTGRTVLAR